MSRHDLLDEKVSGCCYAPLYANTDICSDCKEHAEAIDPPCPEDICDGDGIIHRDDGTDGARDEKCPHTL